MTQPETDSSLRAKIGYLETRNAYEHHDLTSQIEVLQKQVEMLEAELEDRPVVWAILESKISCLEAELADRPMVFAIQHIETKKLSDRGDSVDLYASVEAAESAIRSKFEPSEHKAVIYTGRPIG